MPVREASGDQQQASLSLQVNNQQRSYVLQSTTLDDTLPLNALPGSPPVGCFSPIEGEIEEILLVHLLDISAQHGTLMPVSAVKKEL